MEIAQDKAGDALYRTGYLCIDLPFKIKENVAGYTPQELGTFIHEYVHFLQNVTTPWGLYEAARLYERISHFVNQIKADESPILYVPVEEDYIESHKKILSVLNYGRGSDKDLLGRKVYHLKFANTPSFSYKITNHDFNSHSIPEIILSFETESHGRSEILFGAWAIKESMAALIQEKYDPSSIQRHADVPYNVVQRLAEDCFPNISEDKDKLIAICYASLFSLSPAKEFINLSTSANDDPTKNWEELLHGFWGRKIKCENEECSFGEFYRKLSNKFIIVTQKLLLSDKLAYIQSIIESTQLVNNATPLLCFIGKARTASEIEKIMSNVGLAAIIGKEDSGIFPFLENDKESANEIVLLLGYETMYKYLISNNYQCPRSEQCKEALKFKDSCATTPWDREDQCPMTEIAKLLDVIDKHIIKK